MFVTLNEIIKWMIIFVILEILCWSSISLFQSQFKMKNILSNQRMVFDLSLLQEEFDELASSVHFVQFDKNKLAKVVKKKKESKFRLIYLRNNEDVLSIEGDTVEPICYTNTVPLDSLSIQEKKKTFINMMIPSILLAKYKMKLEREKVALLLQKKALSQKELDWLTAKKRDFKAVDSDELYKRMEQHPTSLIIAQAIVESGWGTSKFFQSANNVFGIWSFDKSDRRIAASEKRGNKRIYLKKYSNIHQSIYDYLLTIGNVSHYESFREKRLETQDPFALVEYLDKYSEQGDEYIANIKNIMRKNHLLKYDSYQLNL